MIYIVFYGQTQALQCRKLLAENGVIGHLGRMPRRRKLDSCAWVVGIRWEEKEKARQILHVHGLHPDVWMDAEGGKV